MTVKQIVNKLEQRKAGLAKERDKLREIEDEVSQYREAADDAIDSLTYAIDRLNELV